MEAQIEEAIKFRKKANFKILTRLSQMKCVCITSAKENI